MSTPDLCNVCDSLINELGVPANFWGFQYPHSGNGYSGIYVLSGSFDGREYISSPLIKALLQNQFYEIKFYVSLADKILKASIGSIGVYFSNDSIEGDTTTQVLSLFPQIQNPKDSFLSDTLNWMIIVDTFLASGGERFITIG
ncbi:MAG: hypothetical protein LH629_01495, partial [Ignavibacteria bacterium]|nr:hypothetical protein [Ignavibacteria bacterium]